MNQRRRKWIGGGEGDESKAGIGEEGKQDDWEGHEGGRRGDDDLLVVVPQSSR